MFDNNTAGIDGGAIDSFSKLILNKVNFQNNKASDGAAVKS
ncbi:MAG: hypothetical protein LBV42_05075, partial [Methanobrevibacter sp.]|nr:hypothetical protein [Methanobrevibacter sp.]